MTTPASILSLIRARNVEADTHAVIMKQVWLDFGRAVRHERKSKGIKLAAFAKRLGFTATYCSFLESGKRAWSMEIADKAVKLLTRPDGWPETAKR